MLCSVLAVHALYALTAVMRSLRSRRTVVTVRGLLLASFTRTRAPRVFSVLVLERRSYKIYTSALLSFGKFWNTYMGDLTINRRSVVAMRMIGRGLEALNKASNAPVLPRGIEFLVQMAASPSWKARAIRSP